MSTAEALAMFAPLTKVDHSQHLVYGVLAESAPDKQGEIMDWETGRDAVLSWSKSFEKTAPGQEPSAGNLRAMHTKNAVGKFVSVIPNEDTKQIEVCAKVVDEQEWKKVVEGVYTGFSMGGGYAKKWGDPGTQLTRYTPTVAEGSLADNPCMYGTTFTAVKADGSEEMVKMVGLGKDAAGAVDSVNDAIEAIKSVMVELGQMEGDPSGITLEDLAAALDKLLWVRSDAAVAAQDESSEQAAEFMAAATSGDMTKIEEVAEILGAMKKLSTAGFLEMVKHEEVEAGKKTDEGSETPEEPDAEAEKMTKLVDTTVAELKASGVDQETGFVLCVAKVSSDPDITPELAGELAKTFRVAWESDESHDPPELTDQLTKLMQESETVKTAMLKTVADTVTKAVETGLTEMQTSMSEMEERLKQVEGAPAAIGRTVSAVQKSLGQDNEKPAGDLEVSELAKAVDVLAAKGGLKGEALMQARMSLAALSVPRTE